MHFFNVTWPQISKFMVDSIKWEIGNSNLMKADLIVLDIIAANINKRPICWAITTGSDVYLNLQKYFCLKNLIQHEQKYFSLIQNNKTILQKMIYTFLRAHHND